MIFNIYLTNLLRALSLALELTDGGLSRHHWRTAMVADRIAGVMELPQEERRTLLYAALLHDIGAASKWQERDSLYRNRELADLYSHAERGSKLLAPSPHFNALANPIRYHHERFDGSSTSGLVGEEIPLASRIINIADSLEVLIKDGGYILDERVDVINLLTAQSGSKFDPKLVEALTEIARPEGFWLDLANPHYYESFFQNANAYGQVRLDIDDVIGIAEIFALIVDRTSRFTARHSRSVSVVAALLARDRGYSKSECKMMRVAGLLHDLGKLTIPNELLEKPGKLTEREYTIIKQHPYYTYRILNEIDGFDLVAEWAAYHHETLDGRGYPFRIKKSNFRLGSRIVAVADVFVALTEDRPYREALSWDKAEKVMLNMVTDEKLDKDLVGALWEQRALLSDLSEGKAETG